MKKSERFWLFGLFLCPHSPPPITVLLDMNTVNLAQVMAIIDSGDPFSVEVCGCDRRRKRGGTLHSWTCQLNRFDVPQANRFVKPARMSAQEVAEIRSLFKRKEKNHFDNFTRNVVILQNGLPTSLVRDLHPPLILTINGKDLIP